VGALGLSGRNYECPDLALTMDDCLAGLLLKGTDWVQLLRLHPYYGLELTGNVESRHLLVKTSPMNLGVANLDFGYSAKIVDPRRVNWSVNIHFSELIPFFRHMMSVTPLSPRAVDSADARSPSRERALLCISAMLGGDYWLLLYSVTCLHGEDTTCVFGGCAGRFSWVLLRAHNTQKFLGLLAPIFGAPHASSCAMLRCLCTRLMVTCDSRGRGSNLLRKIPSCLRIRCGLRLLHRCCKLCQ
jgi:hypothetical protein